MKNKILLILSLIFCVSSIKAQDINFSQFYELPLLRNPALAGIYKGDMRITSAFRNQWRNVSVPFTSQALGTEVKLAVSKYTDNYISLGLQMTNEKAGDSRLGKFQLLPLIVYHQLLSQEKDMYFSIGFMGGPVQHRFDQSGLRFDDQFVNGSYSYLNPTRQNFTNSEFTYGDGSLGASFSSTINENINFYLGLGVFHFTQPKVGFSNQNDVVLNRKTVLNLGLSSPVNYYGKIILYSDYFSQGGHSQVQGGVMYKHNIIEQDDDESLSISGGFFLRWNDAAMPLIKMDYYKLGIGLSYDANFSKLKTASQTQGGFEFTLSYKSSLNANSNSSSRNRTRCPVNIN
jgi:type IX secretion system PorP/SprF family membrane protein